MDRIPYPSGGKQAARRARELRVKSKSLSRTSQRMASMPRHTEVIDGMKTKEFRSELARAGFPG
jgi:hypothetical protein